MMPATPKNVAVSADSQKPPLAASATIETDQKLKNHRFQRIAMPAM